MKFRVYNGSLKDIDIPEWANYIAQDDSGVWWAYNIRPIKMSYKVWSFPQYSSQVKSERLCLGRPPADWTQELYKIYWE